MHRPDERITAGMGCAILGFWGLGVLLSLSLIGVVIRLILHFT